MPLRMSLGPLSYILVDLSELYALQEARFADTPGRAKEIWDSHNFKHERLRYTGQAKFDGGELGLRLRMKNDIKAQIGLPHSLISDFKIHHQMAWVSYYEQIKEHGDVAEKSTESQKP